MKHTRMKLKTVVKNLHEGWKFRQARLTNWYPATVPGVVHTDLLQNKIIEDPFFRLNERGLQWIDKEDWVYETCFTLAADMMRKENMELVFEGLDTYADVYLNDECILKADNMFRCWSIPVRQYIREENNILKVYFHSPVKIDVPKWDALPYQYPASNDQSENGGLFNKKISIFARKAGYHYGWDWGPRLVTSGIWRPVYIRAWSDLRINDVFIEQKEVGAGRAVIAGHVELDADKDMNGVLVTITDEATGRVLGEWQADLKRGTNRVTVDFVLHKPKLWWSNGLGEPFLYRFRTDIIAGGELLDSKTERVGIRSLKVVHQPDKDGHTFYIELNGRPVFAKGANYIPQDALLTNVTTERYQTLFRDIREANMNVIRVWGGGTYEDDRFYDLADENGILVWQDFMFACTPYPSDPTFLKRVEAEACYNIRRLRNHASLAMWCGNNEILEALKYWGFNKNFPPEIYQEMFRGYDKLFHQLLPAKVKELDADRFYIHSSPYFANWGRPESWGIGDSHNWGVWYGQKTFESLDTDLPRFMSEFGFQSFPEMKTISTFAAPEDYQIESEVMNAHQKSSIGNALIRTYMERDYIIPEKFEDFVYVGLVLQGQGMRHGLEAHRRNRPYCMGTLYWQLNDSWPVVSWSSIDYYGNWKALHYQAKRVFAPILINPIQQNDSLNIYLISDCPDTKDHLMLEMKVTDFDGKKQGKPIQLNTLTVPANTSQCVYRIKPDTWLSPEEQQRCFMQLTLKDKAGNTLAETVYFFRKTKDLLLPETTVSCKMKQKDGMCELTLFSPALAKDVFIEIPLQGARFSDNFFDLLPGERKTVVITSPQIKKGEELPLTIKHIRETYN